MRNDGFVPKNPEANKKFDDFIEKKNKVKSLEFHSNNRITSDIPSKFKSMDVIDLDGGEEKENKEEKSSIPKEQDDLKQIKMADLNPDYLKFFDTLFFNDLPNYHEVQQ